MDTAKTMNVSLKNVYQLLISEMRYGYRRNNHLMPSCGYDKVKTLVPQMYEVDKEYAIYTMKQLCEECISDQLTANFYDGETMNLEIVLKLLNLLIGVCNGLISMKTIQIIGFHTITIYL